MQGEIGVKSTFGKGATFWFQLDLEKHPTGTESVDKEKKALHGIKVLIVDDNTTNQQILLHHTASWRMRNEAVSSAAIALTALRSAATQGDPFQLAILDMQMPEMDGLTLAKTITADAALKKTRLIMLTSLGHRMAAEELRQAGIRVYLVKPVRESRLYEALREALNQSKTSPPQPAAEPAEKTKRTPNLARGKPSNVRILLAEDNLINQKVAVRQLRKLGFSADALSNGIAVLRAIKRKTYDIILMDCHMPEMDGYETARHIRKWEATSKTGRKRRRLRIVAMTANALAGDREQCLQAGMDDYISKPVELTTLESALKLAVEAICQDTPQHRVSPRKRPGKESPDHRGDSDESPPASGQDQAAAATDDEPAIDLKSLQSLRGLVEPDEEDPVDELIDLFIEDTPNRLEKLRRALLDNDAVAMANAAHNLKGSANNLGAHRLGRLANQIELDAKQNRLDNIVPLVDSLTLEFDRVRHELEKEKTH